MGEKNRKAGKWTRSDIHNSADMFIANRKAEKRGRDIVQSTPASRKLASIWQRQGAVNRAAHEAEAAAKAKAKRSDAARRGAETRRRNKAAAVGASL